MYLMVGQVKETRQGDDIKYVDSHIPGDLDVLLSSELLEQLVDVDARDLGDRVKIQTLGVLPAGMSSGESCSGGQSG